MITDLKQLLKVLDRVNGESQIAIIAGDHTYELERVVIDVSTPGIILMAKPVVIKPSEPHYNGMETSGKFNPPEQR